MVSSRYKHTFIVRTEGPGVQLPMEVLGGMQPEAWGPPGSPRPQGTSPTGPDHNSALSKPKSKAL